MNDESKFKAIDLENETCSKTTFNFDTFSNNEIPNLSQILSISSDFWLYSNDYSNNNDTSKQDSNLLENKPLEADKSSYSRIKILLFFWLLSMIVILGYMIYFIYLLIEKVN